MNGCPHLQAVLMLGLDVPSCSAKGPLALESSLLNGVCFQHVCEKNIVTVRAKTKWKHAGDGCFLPQGLNEATVLFVDVTVMSLGLGVAQTAFPATSTFLQCAGCQSWFTASQPHDWAYPLSLQPVYKAPRFEEALIGKQLLWPQIWQML